MKTNAKVSKNIVEEIEQPTVENYSVENSLLMDIVRNQGGKIDNWKPKVGGDGIEVLEEVQKRGKIDVESKQQDSQNLDKNKVIDANGKEVTPISSKAATPQISPSIEETEVQTPETDTPDVGLNPAVPATNTPQVETPNASFGVDIPTTNTPTITAPDASFGQHFPTTNTPTIDTPNTSIDPATPTTTTPTTSNPTTGPNTAPTAKNRPPEICAVYTSNTQVTTEDTVDIHFNARDPDWDPLSWNYKIAGDSGYSKSEVLGGTTPWIKVTIPISETNSGINDKITVEATVKDPAGLSDTESLTLDVIGQPIQVWETLFDYTSDSSKGTPKSVDPLIFDLNMDGKLDITGANQEGNGKIDGATVEFDIDPTVSSGSWEFQSPGYRLGTYEKKPNDKIAAAPNGRVVYDTGTVENLGADGRWYENRDKGASAQIFDQDGKLVGEWEDQGSRGHGMIGMYYWGGSTRNNKEKTEWLKPGSGDGFLVWDHNGNGIIDDNTEMMSEFDTSGKKAFANGFEKLRHYFDKDGDGVIKGSEASELRFWVDDNADAITDAGELKTLAECGITEIRIPQEGELTSTAMKTA